MKPLQFAPLNVKLDIPPAIVEALLENHDHPEESQWIDYIAELMDTQPLGIAFNIGKLRLSHDTSRTLALKIANALCGGLRRRGAPYDLKVELDRIRIPNIMEGFQVRTLLPHNDGAHCSYLTPSLHDDSTWNPCFRRFSNEGFSTTQRHKLYQGIFIIEPGEGLSVTTYYDLLKVLQYAYTRGEGHPPQSVSHLARWVGNNIRASYEHRAEHKGKYLTLGALLGSRRPVYQAISLHLAEDGFTPEEIERFPELLQFVELSTQKKHTSPIESLLNQELVDTLGITWQEFRDLYEVCLPNERFDLVLAHNLTLIHGGLMGGGKRRLEPVCLVIENPSGREYENWLAQAWRRLPFA